MNILEGYMSVYKDAVKDNKMEKLTYQRFKAIGIKWMRESEDAFYLDLISNDEKWPLDQTALLWRIDKKSKDIDAVSRYEYLGLGGINDKTIDPPDEIKM